MIWRLKRCCDRALPTKHLQHPCRQKTRVIDFYCSANGAWWKIHVSLCLVARRLVAASSLVCHATWAHLFGTQFVNVRIFSFVYFSMVEHREQPLSPKTLRSLFLTSLKYQHIIRTNSLRKIGGPNFTMSFSVLCHHCNYLEMLFEIEILFF